MLKIDISNIDGQELLDFAEGNISDFSNFELEITFKADYSQSRIIRSFILFLFEKNSIDVPWKSRFSLISDELVNNSIEYWSMPLDKNLFLIRFSSDGHKININLEVHDTWKWILAKTSSEMENIRQEKENKWFDNYFDKRWRWLFQLVSNIADNLYFKDKDWWWLIVWVNKSFTIAELS